jgi:hypothetical protein
MKGKRMGIFFVLAGLAIIGHQVFGFEALINNYGGLFALVPFVVLSCIGIGLLAVGVKELWDKK